jgi:hypothetical protein
MADFDVGVDDNDDDNGNGDGGLSPDADSCTEGEDVDGATAGMVGGAPVAKKKRATRKIPMHSRGECQLAPLFLLPFHSLILP